MQIAPEEQEPEKGVDLFKSKFKAFLIGKMAAKAQEKEEEKPPEEKKEEEQNLISGRESQGSVAPISQRSKGSKAAAPAVTPVEVEPVSTHGQSPEAEPPVIISHTSPH